MDETASLWHGLIRDGAWLRADRVRAASTIWLLMLAGLLASLPWTVPGMRLGWDFAAFWTAARLAAAGQAAASYGEVAREALAALLGPRPYAPFFYPPPALLLWLPFGVLSFAAARLAWVGGTAAVYLAAIRLAGGRAAMLPALAFPAVAICGLYGQNALFSAALLAATLATLERRPAFAGVLIALLVYKPQLAILVPFVLLAARRWRALGAVCLTGLALCLASLLAFGVDAWRGFFAALAVASDWNGSGQPGFDKFVSLYAALRLLGAPAASAMLAQAAIGLAAATGALALAWRRPGGGPEIAVLVVATLLAVPFLGDYDLVLLAVPGAWIARAAARSGWLPYERLGLALLFWAPLALKPAAVHGLPLGPLVLLGAAVLVGRRVLRKAEPSQGQERTSFS